MLDILLFAHDDICWKKNKNPFKLKRHTLGGKKGFDTTYPLPDLIKSNRRLKHENRTI